MKWIKNIISCLSDVDECNNDTLNQCSNKDLCVNLEGSYKCTCPDYSTLQNDERTCKGRTNSFILEQ